ncbi:MAG: ArgR family transcriptional regulator [Bryobacteraceae bacterium]|nr:ArgR family transcriptional regulator [Bryobacteraceae bacterium]
MTKAQRHNLILRVVEREEVWTQQQLADLLAARGVEATQVTLSRDIHELGLVKTAHGYAAAAPERRGPTFESLAPDLLLETRVAQNLIVVKTPPGHAMSLARAIDQSGFEDIVGTVAGDDTILVVAPDARRAKSLAQRLERP